ncbi:radical SAM protein [Symplocastrum sp. BBK-W-15]|uniref:Radical SAM protein n=1 Tax=Limnofasciculus baicalensis BBK-W-15 TaxID=2699891 RepID=A0AAE3KRA9_9CYAN|nr:radical SAM protein [Limnofasciculus baicalensis]MCP2728222.1 radical SAM protein [Limnofasciculus baicalensis BBK-W-15]
MKEDRTNPVSLPLLLEWVERLNRPGLHDSISLTGGEPLLQAPFLVEFLPQLRELTGLHLYLETGGHRPEQLATILAYLDSVGMDINLPSVSGENSWQDRGNLLQLCCDSQIEVFVKLIISITTNPTELEWAAAASNQCASYPKPIRLVSSSKEGAGGREQGSFSLKLKTLVRGKFNCSVIFAVLR